MQTRSIACWGVSWLSVQIQMLHTSSHCVPMIFSAAYPASLFVFFLEDIHDVISTASFLPPWFVYLPKLLRKCRYTFLVPNESAWQRLERHREIMVWISAQREIHLQINKKIYCSYFAFNFDCFEHLSLYQLFRDFENFLHVPTWVLPNLGAHLFSGSSLP